MTVLRLTSLSLALGLMTSPAHAFLLSAWESALQHDPDYQEALAQHDIDIEETALARSRWLPQVTLTGSLGRGSSDVTQTASGQRSTRDFDSQAWLVQLRQTLYRQRDLAGLDRARALETAALASREAARHSLAKALLDTVAEILQSDALLASAEADARRGRLLILQSSRQLRAGEGTRLQVSEARSELARALELAMRARADNEAARARWQRLVGTTFNARPTLPDSFVRQLTAQAGETDLDAHALALTNPALRAARAAHQAEQAQAKAVRGDRLPALELVASTGSNESDSDNTIGSRFDTTRYALQLSMPVFSGGALSAQIRQADARTRQRAAFADSVHADMMQALRHAHAQLQAADDSSERALQDLETAHTALRQATLGQRAGTATQADLVNAERRESDAQRDLGRAQADALKAWGRLLEAQGMLDDSAISWLESTTGWR